MVIDVVILKVEVKGGSLVRVRGGRLPRSFRRPRPRGHGFAVCRRRTWTSGRSVVPGVARRSRGGGFSISDGEFYGFEVLRWVRIVFLK
jgi:hypothetical protein